MALHVAKRKSFLTPLKAETVDGPDALATTATATPTPTTSSSNSSEGEHKDFFFDSIRNRARRSLSARTLLSETVSGREPSGSSTPHPHQSRRLSKSRRASLSPSLEVLNRRGSGFSEDQRLSRSPTTLSSTSSTVDWKSQTVEGYASLGPDSQLLRTKTPYIVATTDYVVKLKSHADVMALFPQLSDGHGRDTVPAAPEPLAVIPVAAIVSIFLSESSRPSFGFEIWWRPPASLVFRHVSFHFHLPTERDRQMRTIVQVMQKTMNGATEQLRFPDVITEPLRRMQKAEEPAYQHSKLEICPVVLRGNTRKEWGGKVDDDATKVQECPSSYLVVGAHMCLLVQAQREKGRSSEPTCKHKSFGLVTLECIKGDWTPHEERFNVTFRDPFKPAVTLELASRYYRRIMRVFGKADRFLKPAWPLQWQTLEIFRIRGFKEPQYLIPWEDYGSVKRTLDAYLTAYRCPPVEWEINWNSQFAPEFRLVPYATTTSGQGGGSYSPLQILAVLRALRYNEYFRSLSFRDVDLSPLSNYYDLPIRGTSIAYLSRSCVALGHDEIEVLHTSPALHQEFHALAFCSDTLRQIDFTMSSPRSQPRPKLPSSVGNSLQFLTPILTLLKSGSTKCNRLLLSGLVPTASDVVDIAETLRTGAIQALDMSRCGLDDTDLRDLVFGLSSGGGTMQSLNLACNVGRMGANVVPGMIAVFSELKELNLSGSIRGELDGPLIPFEKLSCLKYLEELDISRTRLNEATILDLERFLLHRSHALQDRRSSHFRRLVLNSCGITGRQAARLFNAMGENRGIHLFISGNPLEDGIEDLAEEIRHSRGPAGLNMEMLEFKSEANYRLLMDALAQTRYISLLNLVGAAPTLSSGGPLSQETMVALENFFAHNASVRYLDLSGFSGKLDDGQLAQGFGRSLIGLRRNRTMTHLRIRNQNLQGDAGTLGTVLRENTALMMFDCQDNNLNLTGLQFLVSSLRENRTIVEFPFSHEEIDRIWNTVVANLRPGSSSNGGHGSSSLGPPQRRGGGGSSPATLTKLPAARKSAAAAAAAVPHQEAILLETLNKTIAELDGYLVRNRKALERRPGQVLGGFGDVSVDVGGGGEGSGPEEGWPTLQIDAARGDAAAAAAAVGHGGGGGGDSSQAQKQQQQQQQQQQQSFLERVAEEEEGWEMEDPQHQQIDPATTAAGQPRRAKVHSSAMSVNTSLPAPYHVQADEEEVDMELPDEMASSPVMPLPEEDPTFGPVLKALRVFELEEKEKARVIG